MPIVDYELEMKENGAYQSVGYVFLNDGFSYNVIAADNSMTPGSLYTFRVRAINQYGPSAYSDTIKVALGEVPS